MRFCLGAEAYRSLATFLNVCHSRRKVSCGIAGNTWSLLVVVADMFLGAIIIAEYNAFAYTQASVSTCPSINQIFT